MAVRSMPRKGASPRPRAEVSRAQDGPDGDGVTLDGEQAATMASFAYARLRQEILTAALQPGCKLKVRDLCGRYDIGMGPIREALNRLSSEGLVMQTDRRGFTVAPVGLAELEDLLVARCAVNEICLRQSIMHGGDAWEERVLLAGHRLLRTPRHIKSEEPIRNPAWEECHRLFHSSLVSGCGSIWLTDFCERLFFASERFRYIARASTESRSGSSDSEHRAILEAAVGRRTDEAVRLLKEHFSLTAAIVAKELSKGTRKVTSAPGKGLQRNNESRVPSRKRT
jgi:GntR family carbon starvation induced transcriptional regulator